MTEGSQRGYLLVVMMMLAAVPASALSQEVVPQWYRTFNNQGYATERQVQAVIEDFAASFIGITEPVNWGVRGHSMTDSRFLTIYGVLPTPLNKSPWVYSYAGKNYSSEQQLLTAMATGDADFCPVPVPTPEWVSKKGVGSNPENSSRGEWSDGVMISFRNLNGGCLTPHSSYATRDRNVSCPNATFLKWKDELAGCVLSDYFDGTYRVMMTYHSNLVPKLCHGVGNPCDPTTGDKFQRESDIDFGWIRFDRYYHSLVSTADGGFGANWTHSHNLRMAVGLVTSSVPGIPGFIDVDGSHITFKSENGYFEANDGSGDRVVRTSIGWVLYRRSETIHFSPVGLVQRRDFEDGTSFTYLHDTGGRLLNVSHSTGRRLEFSYSDDVDTKIRGVSINGTPYASYTYGANDQVTAITYADGAARIYHYEDSRYPAYLTGVTAEDGRRYSWFGYDAKGRVNCSRHDGACN